LHGGEFAVGARYTTRIEGERRRLTATITEMDAPRVWTSLAKAPGLTMTIEHRIDPDGDGVLLTERLRFGGPLGPVVSRLMRRRLERTFADTTAHAARVVEARRS
jgi:hypothetical protein